MSEAAEHDKQAETAAASSNDGMSYTLMVALVLCIVCSLVVSAAAVGLRPLQEANRSLDRQRNILLAAGLYTPDRKVADLFKRVESRWVDLRSGRFVDTPDREAREELISIPKSQDIAGIKSRPRYVEVYVVTESGELQTIILPIDGLGLYSTLHGYIALAHDGNTVRGIRFYEQGETPGLGGEVDNPRWLNLWPGKRIYDGGDAPRLRLVKGGVDPNSADAAYEVDALTGATLTSRGVSRMLQYWFGDDGYGPFLAGLRKGEV
ncbi:MAG: Na(+)-translocating NADH-quinone reductase subunit C [Gammaproteobacteria bacterium]|jgi:Na+-transporting NADH:ubiquinone oxidoreductase subunit C